MPSFVPATISPDGWAALQGVLTDEEVRMIREGSLPVATPSWLAAGPLAESVGSCATAAKDVLAYWGQSVPAERILWLHSYGAYFVYTGASSVKVVVQKGRLEHVLADLRWSLACTASLLAHGVPRFRNEAALTEPKQPSVIDSSAREAESAMVRLEEAMDCMMDCQDVGPKSMLRFAERVNDIVVGRAECLPTGLPLAHLALALYNAAHREAYLSQKAWGFLVEDDVAPSDFFEPYDDQQDTGQFPHLTADEIGKVAERVVMTFRTASDNARRKQERNGL